MEFHGVYSNLIANLTCASSKGAQALYLYVRIIKFPGILSCQYNLREQGKIVTEPSFIVFFLWYPNQECCCIDYISLGVRLLPGGDGIFMIIGVV